METVLQILTVILVVAAASLCIALIYYLGKIVKSVQSVQKNLQEISANLTPLIQSTRELSDNLNKITVEVKDQLNISKSIISDFRDRADKILNIENKIRSGVEDAVMPFIQNIAAIGKGIETFWRNFKNR